MAHCRNLLLHGLSLLLRRSGAIFWMFVLSLATAILFSLPLHNQLSALLDHSLAAANLTRGFDLPSAAGVFFRLQHNVPGSSVSMAAVPVFLLLYFVLTPGVLFCYLGNERARLSTMLRQGLLHFWRFVRITVVALLAFGIVLGPLVALNNAWAGFISDRVLGKPGFVLRLLGTLAVFLVASLLRLFFDLVEIYTVQLGLTLRPNGKFDRRTRLAYRPTWRALRLHFLRAWGGFLLLSLLAAGSYLLLSRGAIRSLAQPRAWPLFLFAQLAVLLGIAMRLWQRGAEVTLALDHPIVRAIETPARAMVVPPAVVPVVPAYGAPAAQLHTASSVAPPLTTPLAPPPPFFTEPPVIAPDPAPSRDVAQPLAPPGDLPPEQVAPLRADPFLPAAPVRPVEERPAPARTVYDIDPFTPLPVAPNPLATEEEETLEDRPPKPPTP